MPEISIKDGVLSSKQYVEITRQYTCPQGTEGTLTLNWPEGVTVEGRVHVDTTCPCCDADVVLPRGIHEVVDGVLTFKKLPKTASEK